MMQKFFWLQTGPWGTTHVALISTGWVVNSKQSSKILINEKWLNYLLTILLALCWSFAGLPRVGSWGTWRAGVPVPMAVEWFWPWWAYFFFFFFGINTFGERISKHYTLRNRLLVCNVLFSCASKHENSWVYQPLGKGWSVCNCLYALTGKRKVWVRCVGNSEQRECTFFCTYFQGHKETFSPSASPFPDTKYTEASCE